MFDEHDPDDPSEPPVMAYRWSEFRRAAWHLAYQIRTGTQDPEARRKAISHLEVAVLWAEEANNR